MTLLQKLTGHLHRVFDKDPQPALAFRIGVTSGTLTWNVADQILDLTAQGGVAASLQIDLDKYTIATLWQFIASQTGYTTELPVTNFRRLTALGDVRVTSTGDRRVIKSLGLVDPTVSGLPSTLLVEGKGDVAESLGNRLTVMRSPLLIYLQTIARELKDAEAQIAEMLRQMVMTQSEGEWTDLWGTYYGVPRRTGEADAAYAARIIVEVLRPRVNHVAMEIILEEALAAAVTIREPWKEIFILSGSSTLSGSHKLYDGSFYAYNTLEIQSRADRDDMAVLGERNKAAGTWLWYDQITEIPSPIYEDDGPPISGIIGELNYLLQPPWQSILSVEPSVSGDQLLFAEYRDFIAWSINATGAGYQEADLYTDLGVYYNGFSQLSELAFPLYRLDMASDIDPDITLWAGSNWQPNVLDAAGYLAGNGGALVTEIPWATVTTFDIEITLTDT